MQQEVIYSPDYAGHFLLAPLPYDGFPMLLPLLFTDPKLMECAQTRQNTAAKPTAITSLRGITRGMDFHVRELPA